jgi:BASS family bile acid:Na+ symporter
VRALVRFVLNCQLYVFVVSVLITLAMIGSGYGRETGPFVILALASLALHFMGHAFLRRIAFTVWVFAAVAASMFYPQAFGTWFQGTRLQLDLGILMVPLIQIIMFGMGTTLSVSDFTRVFVMPWPVFVGMVLQFSVMPLAGLAIATAFGFEPEVAAGVVLIGSCPGGVASNLMTYLACGNVALSVTMTACSTLMSPVMTPFMMQTLAGRLVPIDFYAMMISILNMVIVPIVAGLVANKILYGRTTWGKRAAPLALIAVAAILIAVFTALLLRSSPGNPEAAAGRPRSGSAKSPAESAAAEEESAAPPAPPEKAAPGLLQQMKGGIIIGFGLVGVVALSKLIVSVMLQGSENWMDRVLPVVSMAGICFIIAIITAEARNDLLRVGLALIAAAMLHNSIGYVLGYWCSKLARLDQTACRTVAIEVGLQNGGMASGLAVKVLGSAKAALAPAIFGPWMNISGSILATWWQRRPVTDQPAAEKSPEQTPYGEQQVALSERSPLL